MIRIYIDKITVWLDSGVVFRIRRWGVKGSWAILDQATFSGANFILSIVLARWLSADQFGIYTIGFTILVVVYQIYVAFLLDPMSVLGPAHYSNALKRYFIMHLKIHLIFSIMAGAFIVAAGIVWVRSNSLLGQTLIVVGGTLPLLLLPWYSRRIFYILGKPHISLWGSFIYAIILIPLMFFLRQIGVLNSPLAISMTAIAGLFSGVFLLFILRATRLNLPFTPLTNIMAQNWKFSKWLILSGLFIAFASQIQIWFSAIFLGIQAAGALRAVQIVIQPMMLTVTAMTALATPVLSSEFSIENYQEFNRKIILLSSSLLFLSIMFEVVLIMFDVQINLFLYAGKFSMYNILLPVWGLVPIFLAFSSGFQAGFQAAQKPQVLLFAAVVWSFTSFGLGIWLIPIFGLIGATWSAILGYFMFVMILAILYRIMIYNPFVLSKNKKI